jgi:hypothetical protein
LRVEPRCLALVELVEQAVAMMRPLAQEKRISVELVADSNLPLTFADPDRVLEVLINLVDNAIKFTEVGGSISLKANALETDSDFLYVSVADNGAGISAEAMPLIFERLYQDPDSIEGGRSGLGLGLFIARELISLHGGRIWVASQPGEGSTFTFTLPVYSLPKLLKPVIVHEGKLRDAFVLLRVDLRPLSNLPRGNWRETCRQCLELLQRCVYVDKDLVLPAIAGNGPVETFFVVASTDMQRVEIMISRVKEQLGAIASLKSSGTVEASARPVPLALSPGIWSVDEQVEAVAETVRQMIVQELAGTQSKIAKENRNAS